MSNLPKEVVDFLKEHKVEPLLDGDLTKSRAAEVWECSSGAAGGRLDKMVAKGEMKKISKVDGVGKKVNVYIPVNKGGIADKK